ncbi:MAG: DUF192 domain-containing protein [Deltaproteobacteria bacterium]|nr:DUF192 domain-containing protein [Deltaproteobacteria bacterium]
MLQLFFLIIFVVSLIFLFRLIAKPKVSTVKIISEGHKQVIFEVEIADSIPKKAVGLMYRKKLPENYGMLFTYDREGFYPFWMKNTYLSLDLIFISRDNKIVDIKKNLKPLSTEQINSSVPFQYALEVLAGTADKYGLKTGDSVVFDLN